MRPNESDSDGEMQLMIREDRSSSNSSEVNGRTEELKKKYKKVL